MIQDWNVVLQFLAAQENVEENYDLAILAGNSLPYLIDELVVLYKTKKVQQIMVTGGVGHATNFLKENLKAIGFESTEENEAEICQAYLQEKYGLFKNELILETSSTNSGENAIFTLNKIKELHLQPRKVLLLQDPVLQRRTKATFSKNWQQTKTEFTNYVPVLPKISKLGEKILFSDPRLNDLWTKEYFFSLVLGEIPRLRNDKEGYGPNGLHYIEQVIIPSEVEEAHARLIQQFQYQKER